MKRIAPRLATIILFTSGIFVLSGWARERVWAPVKHPFLNFQLTYQSLLLLWALISLFASYLLNPKRFKQIMQAGAVSAPAKALKIFGIKEGDSWLKTGISLTLVISSVTAIFIFFQLQSHHPDYGILKKYWIWIFLFALTNSFSEEMIFRVGIDIPMYDLLPSRYIFLLSAVIFGIVHYGGTPGGFAGMLMAGLLGYVLSKSLYETRGVFWAWWIHFWQDVIIMGALFLI